ncbi:MAG TPA: hypothetical protein ENI82_02430 [Bacteroidetes bacterium]|nr:hypothetical protein [Bacteroidota bacterium]
MKILKKLRSYILPEAIDFFGQLTQQSEETKKIIAELRKFYIENSSTDTAYLFEFISKAKNSRKINLIQLNKVFITPVDKEAISRAYEHLHWIVLSIKHLIIEMDEFQIYRLKDYDTLLTLLYDEMDKLTEGFSMLNKKEYDEILKKTYEVIHYDNLLIKQYAQLLVKLFENKDMNHILKYKEILTQIKEISKRIHICGNHLEDIVFKMN